MPRLRLSLAVPALSLPYSLHLPSLPLQGPGTPAGTWLPSARGAGLRQGLLLTCAQGSEGGMCEAKGRWPLVEGGTHLEPRVLL